MVKLQVLGASLSHRPLPNLLTFLDGLPCLVSSSRPCRLGWTVEQGSGLVNHTVAFSLAKAPDTPGLGCQVVPAPRFRRFQQGVYPPASFSAPRQIEIRNTALFRAYLQQAQ